MVKKVIGIISWFPDTSERQNRINAMYKTVNWYCNKFPGIDILIVAQNWHDIPDFNSTASNITIKRYDKLGLNGARRELRKLFLESDYDYLIMSDDDILVNGTQSKMYLDYIDHNPDGACMLNNKRTSLIMFAISKKAYEMINIPDVTPESGGIFEDIYIYAAAKYLLKDKFIKIPCDFCDNTLYGSKVKSTWWNKSYNADDMVQKTYKILEADFPGIDPTIAFK